MDLDHLLVVELIAAEKVDDSLIVVNIIKR